MDDILVLRGIAKNFGPVNVLQQVDLAVGRGERHALIGPNGSGKSTLFNLISGALAPSNGTISLNGRRIDGRLPHVVTRLGLSRSFQITQIFSGLSVEDNVRISLMRSHGKLWSFLRYGASWKQIDASLEELLSDARLETRRTDLAGTLSYSDQRVLEICMTLATNPDVVILDEPTAGMSREETAEIVTFIRRATAGRTLLMVEHDMDVVFGLADRISVLVNGRILTTAPPDQIRSDPRVQEAYLGKLPS